MRPVPSYLYTKELVKQIDSLILDEGYLSYAAIDENQKDTLVVNAMRATNKLDLFCPITDCDDAESNINSLMDYMSNGGTLAAYDLAETMRKNTLSYFKEDLSILYAERVELLECERKYEAGLHPITDRTNGEVRWVR